MESSRITTKEAIALIISVVVAHSLISMPIDLLVNQKSSIILNLIYVGFIVLGLGFLIYKLLKNFSGRDIIDISEFLGGKVFKTILGIIFIIYFSISSSILLRNFSESLKIIYYPNTRIHFIVTMFIIAIMIVNSLKFRANIKTNLIILPLVLFSIIFLFTANLKSFSPERIFPLLGEGFANTFITGIGNISAFGGIVFLYFLPPILKEPEKLKRIMISSIVITTIYLIVTVALILFMFAFFINVDEIMPLYTAARNIEFGSFFQRLESLFLLIWMIAFSCYLSIVTTFSLQIFKKVANLKDIKPLVYPFGLLLLGLCLLPRNFAISYLFESIIYHKLALVIVFILPISILILANIKRRKVGDSNEKQSC